MLTVLRLRMCSKRWAKPDRPSGSCLEPTSYHIETMTFGVLASLIATTLSALLSLPSVKAIGGASAVAAATALGVWAVAGLAAEHSRAEASVALPINVLRIFKAPVAM